MRSRKTVVNKLRKRKFEDRNKSGAITLDGRNGEMLLKLKKAQKISNLSHSRGRDGVTLTGAPGPITLPMVFVQTLRGLSEEKRKLGGDLFGET